MHSERNGKTQVNLHSLERIASVVGGSLLAASGLRKGASGIPQLLAGAAIMRRGVTGHCEVYSALGMRTAASDATIPAGSGVRARAAITIDAPRDQVFRFWRQLDQLPLFLKHLVTVEVAADGRSHWVAEGPAGRRVSWTAEVISEVENQVIGWKSLPGGDVDSAGSVRFQDAPGGRGTEVLVSLQYNPPAGSVGALVARLFGKDPEHEIEDDLRRLKQYLESGEIATVDGQPRGTVPAASKAPRERRRQELIGADA